MLDILKGLQASPLFTHIFLLFVLLFDILGHVTDSIVQSIISLLIPEIKLFKYLVTPFCILIIFSW